ncbi:hypothetical protein [Microbacterium capsulatum]|uniref:Resolvase/invertase-type recombinase catalytic domain-containing protein n=1 Tax=Microbacterium capsulatum TaxID=3041921 RepID=A0ABU0XLZ9_9MICO|nr:hypothetical protein [Microbacterium sp. ASV81]MDQ4214760.1 hypothetical protein [Microbacterium sp. ASV81]
MANNTNTEDERRTACALLWRQGMTERAPLRLGFRTVDEQQRRIAACATWMGMTIVEQFTGTIRYRVEAGDRLNGLTRMLDKHHVDCVIVTRACLRGIDGDDLIALTVRLANRGIDLVLAD